MYPNTKFIFHLYYVLDILITSISLHFYLKSIFDFFKIDVHIDIGIFFDSSMFLFSVQ